MLIMMLLWPRMFNDNQFGMGFTGVFGSWEGVCSISGMVGVRASGISQP
jgi:hypothetical protein